MSSASLSTQIFGALGYAGSSLCIMFMNKIVLTVYEFPSFNFLAFSQFALTLIVLNILKSASIVQYCLFFFFFQILTI